MTILNDPKLLPDEQKVIPATKGGAGPAFDQDGPRQPLVRQLALAADLAHLPIHQLEHLVAREYLIIVLKRNGWNQQKAAEDVGLHRNSIWRRMQELQITRPRGALRGKSSKSLVRQGGQRVGAKRRREFGEEGGRGESSELPGESAGSQTQLDPISPVNVRPSQVPTGKRA